MTKNEQILFDLLKLHVNAYADLWESIPDPDETEAYYRIDMELWKTIHAITDKLTFEEVEELELDTLPGFIE